MKISGDTALIVTDIQNDFCSGGALAVPGSNSVIPVLNRYIATFVRAGALVFFTRDWHPADHISFKNRGGKWPPHCVRGTDGAEFHPKLVIPEGAEVISKAERPDREAYSSFSGTGLGTRLEELGIKTVLVGGLATDYCVKETVLDALRKGFHTYFLSDASRGVEVSPGDSGRAVDEMKAMGALEMEIRHLES